MTIETPTNDKIPTSDETPTNDENAHVQKIMKNDHFSKTAAALLYAYESKANALLKCK